MKKNKMMRAASVLLILVLLTTCTISGTFAKYTTSGEATDSARVAKWGVVITGKTDVTNSAFEDSYSKDDENYTVSELSVNATQDVVAPGTKGTMAEFAVTGQPEVATRITYTANVTLGNWEVNGTYYCPLIVTVTNNTGDSKTTETIKGLDYTNMGAFEKAIEDAIGKITKDYKPYTNLNEVNDDLAVSWEWPFENPTDEGRQGTKQHQSDSKDTALGDAETAATISIKVTCTATQID